MAKRHYLGPKRVKNVGFGPDKKFQPNQSENGREMAKRCFLGQKRVKMWFLAPKKFSAKSVRKWPRNGQKAFSRPKKGKKCGFCPQ